MENVFLNTQNLLNSQGIYGINFYTLGIRHTLIVDDLLPLMKNKDGTYRTWFA